MSEPAPSGTPDTPDVSVGIAHTGRIGPWAERNGYRMSVRARVGEPARGTPAAPAPPPAGAPVPPPEAPAPPAPPAPPRGLRALFAALLGFGRRAP